MKYLVYLLFVLLVLAHHDFWWWERHEPLIFGTIPIGLAWHVGISLGAALVGYLGTKFCWPVEDDDDDELVQNTTPSPNPREHA